MDKNKVKINNFSYSKLNRYEVYLQSLSYIQLSLHHIVFPLPVALLSIFLKSIREALSHPGWRQAAVDEMEALHSSGTLEFVPLPPSKMVVGG